MERRTVLTLISSLPLVAFAGACGADDEGTPVADDELPPVSDAVPADPPVTDPATTPPPTTEPAADVEVDAQSDSAVTALLEFGYYGGFTTREIGFQMVPVALITSDNRVITGGVEDAMFPGALVSPLFVRSITDEGVDKVLAAAADAGLLADIEYARDDLLADAATATLRITTGGATYEHAAYGLGIGGPPGEGSESDPQRQALADFVTRIEDLESLAGAGELGPEEPYEPATYQMITFPAGDLSGYDQEPTIVDWPAESGIVLADVDACVEVDRDSVGDILADADQLTFFSEGDMTWSVVARPALPGRTC